MSINLENLPQLAQDTANHHIYGEVGAALGALILPPVALLFGLMLDKRLAAAAGAAIVGGVKEGWDTATGKGDPSPADFFATCSGALPVIAGLSLAGDS